MLALPEILWFALLFFSFALVYVLRKFITAMLGTLIAAIEQIPFAGDVVGAWLQSIEQDVSRVLGSAEHKIDAAIGSSFHLLARYMNRLWHHLVWSSHVLAQAAEAIAELAYEHLGIKRAVHSMAQTFRSLWHATKRLEKWALRMETRLKRLEHDLGHGIGEDVLPRIKTLEREVIRIERKEIPAIRAAENALEKDFTALGQYIRTNFLSSATDAVSAAVVVALGAMGLGGLSCRNFKNLLSKFGCGLGTLLNDLLGLVIAGLVLESVCEFLPRLEDAFGAVAGPIVHLLTKVPLGDCEKRPKGWASLSVAAGPTPPAQTLGPLAQ